MADPLRHRQTKGAATDMVDLTPPRHIPTLPDPGVRPAALNAGFAPYSRRSDAYGFTSQIDPKRTLAAIVGDDP
jgi:hypothetical protein